MKNYLSFFLALASLFLLEAQSPSQKPIQTKRALMGAPTLSKPGFLRVLPEKPKLGALPPRPSLPPVPMGKGRDLPIPPPTVINNPKPGAAGISFFLNKDASPAARSRSLVGEPTATADKDLSFMTGNWWAAVSKNGGSDWNYLNPYTKFPAPDGPFCCDQYSIYIPKWGLTIWLLQYQYSKTTKYGGYRIAVTDRAGLKVGSWWSYYFRPSTLGFKAKTWLDFPHLAFTDNYLYFTAWVFPGETGGERGKILARLPLKPIKEHKGFSFSIWPLKNSQPSWRMASGGTHTLYFGDHLTTSKFRIWRWKEGTNTIFADDRNHALWYSGPKVSPGPDGRKWMARASSRPMGAWVSNGEIGFIWTSAKGGPFPRPFLRVLHFRESDRKLLKEETVWNKDYAFAWPSVSVNSRGHLGGTFSLGGKGIYPTTAVWIADDLHSSFQPLDAVIMKSGSSGPSSNLWGDYFSSISHPLAPNSWIGTGNMLIGGPNAANQQCRYVWFGRPRDLPRQAQLSITSSRLSSGAPISIDQKDLNGWGSGSTPMLRKYVPQQELQLTAPWIVQKSGTWLFQRWHWNRVAQAYGKRTLNKAMASAPGASPESATAEYEAGWTLALRSNNPGSGVSILVNTTDHNGLRNGATPFNRLYRNRLVVTLQAPAKLGLNPIRRWVVDGRAVIPPTPYKLQVVMDKSHVVVVEYWTHVQGGMRTFGTSCPSPGNNNLHVGSATNHEPVLGGKVAFSLRRGTFTPVLLSIGVSNTRWGGLRLPLDLKVLGAPSCSLYQSLDFMVTTTLNLQGNADLIFTIPKDPKLLGLKVYSQYLIPALQGNKLGWYLSNGLETKLGGNR